MYLHFVACGANGIPYNVSEFCLYLLREEFQIVYIYLCDRLVYGQLDALFLALCLYAKLQTCDGGK